MPTSYRGSTVCPVLIGRDDLLTHARRRWLAAARGNGGFLLLAGEAGIGKTRLLSEIAELAAGAVVITAGAFPRDLEVAGGALADLADELRRSPWPAAVAAGTRILAELGGAGEAGDAHRRRRMLVTELTDALRSVADGSTPVLLAVEDLHWADDLTVEVLGRLARQLPGLPMLLVGSYRSDELYPRVPMRTWRGRLVTSRLAEELRLDRLDLADITAMTSAITSSVLPTALVAEIFARSDGIPLHVEELLGAAAADAVPDTLAEAVLTRVGSLSPAAQELAAAASVIGRSFDVDLLAAITGESAAAIDAGLRELREHFIVAPRADPATHVFRHSLIRDALYRDLSPLRRRDLHATAARAAARAGMSDAFVSDQYERGHEAQPAFQHALAGAEAAAAMSAHREAVELLRRAQRTAPVSTPPRERASLLTRLADALAASDDNAAAAASYVAAYNILRQLGDDAAAAALVAPLVAVRHLLGADLAERTATLLAAIELLDSADPTDSTDPAGGTSSRSAGRLAATGAPEPATVDTRVALLAALAAAYMLDRRLDEALEYGQLAQALAATRRPTSDGVLANIDATVGSVLVFGGQMDEGWRLLEQAIGRAVEHRHEAEAARGYRMLGSSASVLVEYDRALTWLNAGLVYAERTERWNDRHYMAGHVAHVLWAVGDWAEADRVARQALADGGDGVTTRITALHALGYLALGRQEWSVAERHLTEARLLGEEMGELQRLSPALWGLAEVALLDGRLEQAIDWCERGYAASAVTRDAAYLYPYLVTGVRAHLRRGDLTAARSWAERVEQPLRERTIPGTLPAIGHARGLLHLAEGQTGKARELLEEAAAEWAARRRFWEGTQALLDLARCATRSRRPAEAAALLARAREQAEAAGATALVDLSEAEPATVTGVAGLVGALSSREFEVARLVATGATNRQIADSLHIAPKTVAAHVEHILAKLGAGRRTEIAAWVTAQGPA